MALTLETVVKKTDAIDTQRDYRLRCSVPQPPKLYSLPKLHKPCFPMRPIVSFCGSPVVLRHTNSPSKIHYYEDRNNAEMVLVLKIEQAVALSYENKSKLAKEMLLSVT